MIALHGMLTDIHSHILPGIDDGPANLEDSLKLARRYEESGITTIIATPHFIPGTAWAPSKETVLERVTQLNEYLSREGIQVDVLAGMELAYNNTLAERIEAREVLPLGESDFYLVEVPFDDDISEMLWGVEQLLAGGQKIIIAHPERSCGIRETIGAVSALVEKGLRVQVNSGSLVGYFGSRSRQAALQLRDLGLLHYVATDAHDCRKRAPFSKSEWMVIAEILGDEYVNQCLENARRLAGGSVAAFSL